MLFCDTVQVPSRITQIRGPGTIFGSPPPPLEDLRLFAEGLEGVDTAAAVVARQCDLLVAAGSPAPLVSGAARSQHDAMSHSLGHRSCWLGLSDSWVLIAVLAAMVFHKLFESRLQMWWHTAFHSSRCWGFYTWHRHAQRWESSGSGLPVSLSASGAAMLLGSGGCTGGSSGCQCGRDFSPWPHVPIFSPTSCLSRFAIQGCFWAALMACGLPHLERTAPVPRSDHHLGIFRQGLPMVFPLLSLSSARLLITPANLKQASTALQHPKWLLKPVAHALLPVEVIKEFIPS